MHYVHGRWSIIVTSEETSGLSWRVRILMPTSLHVARWDSLSLSNKKDKIERKTGTTFFQFSLARSSLKFYLKYLF